MAASKLKGFLSALQGGLGYLALLQSSLMLGRLLLPHCDWIYVQAAWGDIQINTNGLVSLTSLGSAVLLPSPCLLLRMLQAALPRPFWPPACRLPQGIHVLQLQTILLSLVTETGKYCDTGK